MSDDSQRPIIVKRIKKAAHGHHGGAWKIAYADFVTAMMAFFLLMCARLHYPCRSARHPNTFRRHSNFAHGRLGGRRRPR